MGLDNFDMPLVNSSTYQLVNLFTRLLVNSSTHLLVNRKIYVSLHAFCRESEGRRNNHKLNL
jgi:hypothetical protein